MQTDWDPILHQEFNKPYWAELQNYVSEQRSSHKVFPAHSDVFRAFHLTSYEGAKVVILGQDPYHGAGQANGLCFSVPSGVSFPPSLRNIFKELEDDMGVAKPHSGDLASWAEQGILLLNTTLTVREGIPGSHQGKGWETFTDEVIRCISERKENIIFVLWGASARRKKSLIDASKHACIESVHPSPLSAYRGFLGSKPFSRINQLLRQQDLVEIDWSL